MKLITISGATNDDVAKGRSGRTAAINACDKSAPLESRGKMTPPGKPPAAAKAIATNFAIPTCNGAATPANGRLGSTRANAVMMAGMACGVAARGVHCPSTTHWSVPSPQNMVCGYRMLISPIANATSSFFVMTVDFLGLSFAVDDDDDDVFGDGYITDFRKWSVL
mmetsp:Transcript_10986/g.19728  ORF Transcript_10986/g.19728 Transcript_10986/m.19728 type:complete len:166 (-) Transcript_10986:649-1146(-)